MCFWCEWEQDRMLSYDSEDERLMAFGANMLGASLATIASHDKSFVDLCEKHEGVLESVSKKSRAIAARMALSHIGHA